MKYFSSFIFFFQNDCVSLKNCCLSLLILLVLISHETLLKNIRTKRMKSEAREVVGHETSHKG